MNAKQPFELGLGTFGDVTTLADGNNKPMPDVIRDVVAEAKLADELGIASFGIGEHHRDDYAISSPDMVLAAIAGQTENIRLFSAVTVLSSDDPVRVYQRFATLNAVSNGRAEVILGRGSFTESFPLFGYRLQDYDILFEEKFDLFTHLRKEQPVTWSGQTRPSLTNQLVYPTTDNGALSTWVAVGGSPQSVVRAADAGLPLMIAIIGGNPLAFRQIVELYHHTLIERGQAPQPVGVHSPGYVAETDEKAMEELWPHYQKYMTRLAHDRGWSPVTYEQFEVQAGEHGALVVGSPETVAKKIVKTAKALRLSRFDMKYSHGGLPHELLMNSINLYGKEVMPMVKEQLS